MVKVLTYSFQKSVESDFLTGMIRRIFDDSSKTMILIPKYSYTQALTLLNLMIESSYSRG